MRVLGPYTGRECARDLVYDLCREATLTKCPPLELLATYPEINRHLDDDTLAALCDPANYLGQSGLMVDRVLDKLG
jgi:3-carboxy-cis,cis-muconate cycloisomerase